ncbi:SCO family protein [Alcaligenaceae bacterium CGII-47]|nr:SCO family protein [Alcaligenaceae bacterium CGII-47]
MRWVVSLLLAFLAGGAALYWQTDGFTALTAEDARRNEIAANPRPVPAVQVFDEHGASLSLLDDLHTDGRVAIVNFFYTRCMSLCLAQGSQAQSLQRAIDERGLSHRVRLLSISFDPRERAQDLSRYAQRMNAQANVWEFLSLPDATQRAQMLSLFGIIVIPAPLGEFEHNAAFHVVTPEGRLARVVSMDEPGLALEVAQALSGAR